ncbi:hypothetical protein TTHERM_01035690 (macronuclear) [Tetrahymena thermophila SB210]|uniref:Kinase domain protein n=1 Tax=Tetrahymena thermophila (strain SB210) TaxID=312017 RepID=Q24I91_TETTS|nr:hypothetical protein TTHERM_01035690 [Tetrahymena thermophila SB210]EAS07506.2 hypothetical protein TTHERM_01035690 [Tetrahymena thermophila SB210]|eukprot:XP_001027748.2 hypothetical protein TTHERM_01035690 [Tetrahymena thermophila SB210]
MSSPQDRENLISNAILVRKKDIHKYLSQNNYYLQDHLKPIYEEFAKSLKDIDVNSHEFILKNRIFLNTINIQNLEQLIDSYYQEDLDKIKQSELEIINMLSLWMPDITFNEIIPIDNQKGQLKRVVIQCTSICKNVKIKFYMKITVKNIQNIGDMVQEKEHFNQICSYSARFLSMKYQKVISEHLIISASSVGISKNLQRGISNREDVQNKHYLDIVLTDFCEYTLRQIIYYSKQASKQQEQKQELMRQKVSTTSTYYGTASLQQIQNSLSQTQTLIEKFSFQHLQKDLIEALFFMHTRGYTHNSINLDNIFYDKYINAFVVGGFDAISTNVRDYDKFRDDVRQFGLVLIEFLLSFYNIKIQEDLYTLDDIMIRNLIENLSSNKIIQSKKNFILLNLNIFQQRNILFDIFCASDKTNYSKNSNDMQLIADNQNKLKYSDQDDISNLADRPFDIVELAIALNIQHCLVTSSHSTMKSFLTQNDVFDEKSLASHLIDPLNNKYSYWKYRGTTKNGLFDGLGEIFFEPPQLFDQLDEVLYSDCEDDLATSKKQQSLTSPPVIFNQVPYKFQTQNSFYEDSNCPELESHRLNQLTTPHTVSRTASKAGMHYFNVSNCQGFHDRLSVVRNEESNYFHSDLKQQKISLKIFKGIWENGFNQKYLNYVTTEQFKDFFLLNNYLKIIQHNSHQELQFSVKSEKPTKAIASSKIIDLQFSTQKEQVIDSLNVITKYLQIPIARITFDLKGAQQRKVTNEAQCIELQCDDGNTLYILFESNYLLKEEEFYIILEKATLSNYLALQMSDTKITDKFFYGMSFNTKLKYLCHLQLAYINKITDEGFIYFVKNCPSQHLNSLDISHTQLSNISIMELATSNKITQLNHLNISYNSLINEKSVIEFIKSSNSLFISHLNVSGLDISDNLVDILCLSPFMKNITEIIMNDCPNITFRIFEVFSKSESVNYIKRIELSNCLQHSNITAAKKTGFLNGLLDKRKSKQEFKSFAKTDKLGNLRVINLQGCNILHNHIKQLADSHSLKQVEEINVSRCDHMTDECIKEISTSQNFQNLKALYLSNLKNLTAVSIELIGNSKYLINLDTIYLDGCDKIDKNILINAMNLNNFQNLKVLRFDETQYSISLIRQINFSNKNSVQTFWRMQSIEILIQNPDLFFKLYISEILTLNQKPIRFIVSKQNEPSVIQKLALILNHQIINFQESSCRINVNDIMLNEKMIDEIKRQKNQNINSFCYTDICTLGNYKAVQRTIQTDNVKKENVSLDQSFVVIDGFETKSQPQSTKQIINLPHSFYEQKVYCRNECFKAMHYLKFVKELSKLDLSYSKSINLPGYQFIKECVFFPNLIELNLQGLQILNKHVQQMCYGIQFTGLRILNLRNCSSLTFQGFEYFLQSGITDTLQYLDIYNSQIEGTDFSLCLPDFAFLSQLNQGQINITLNKQDIHDEEKVKKKIGLLFAKIRSLFYINQISFQVYKLKITSQVFSGLSSIFQDHQNTLRSVQVIFCNAKNMNSEQSISFWSSIAQLSKLKSISLVFQSCKNIDKQFLKNLFFGVSVLIQLEEMHLVFPKTEFIINNEDFTPVCVAMTRLQKLQILDINLHEIPLVNNQFLEELVYIVGNLENIRSLSIDYSWIINFQMSNILKLFESLEASKMKLLTLNLDFEMCTFNQAIWKKMKKYILSQSTLIELNLNISYCVELKEKSIVKFINQCLELKMLKVLKLLMWGVGKITQKSKDILKQNTNIYLIDTFDLSIQEIQ